MDKQAIIGEVSALRLVGKTLNGNPIYDLVVSADERSFTARTKANSPAGYQIANERSYRFTYHFSISRTMIIEYAEEI